jgi:hypothetical protein
MQRLSAGAAFPSRDPALYAANLRRIAARFESAVAQLRGDERQQASNAAAECRRWADELRQVVVHTRADLYRNGRVRGHSDLPGDAEEHGADAWRLSPPRRDYPTGSPSVYSSTRPHFEQRTPTSE